MKPVKTRIRSDCHRAQVVMVDGGEFGSTPICEACNQPCTIKPFTLDSVVAGDTVLLHCGERTIQWVWVNRTGAAFKIATSCRLATYKSPGTEERQLYAPESRDIRRGSYKITRRADW